MASYYLHVKAALALSITFSANPFKEFLSPKFTPEKIELRYRAALSNDSYRSSRCSGSRVVFDTSPHERPVVGRADFALARRWPSPAPPWRFRFYKDVSGLEIIYGGEGSYFTSLRTKDGNTILNLEHGSASIRWGRLIFHVSDVDRFWAYLMEKGFHPDSPQDASWGERYFHLPDPDGHELSFARPI